MSANFSDLIKSSTKDELLERFIALLRLANFPVASWHSGSLQKHTAETESSLLADLSESIPTITKAGFIRHASSVADAWVDLCAEFFAETRKPAVYTQGTARLTDAGGIGPVTINPGTFWIANTDKTLRYVNVTGGVLGLSGTLDLTFQAETAGSAWNVGVNAIMEILTPQPGVTVSNPALATGTWITQQGADTESSPALVQRCLDKWATLGSGSNDAAYRYYATSSSSEITRVKVFSPGGGSVRVVIAGDAGPVSSAALSTASAKVEEKRPIGVPDVVTSNALVKLQAVDGTIFVEAGRDPVAILSAAQAAVDKLQRATSIGAKVSREKIIQALLVAGVYDLTLASPADDFQLLSTEVWVPSYTLVTSF